AALDPPHSRPEALTHHAAASALGGDHAHPRANGKAPDAAASGAFLLPLAPHTPYAGYCSGGGGSASRGVRSLRSERTPGVMRIIDSTTRRSFSLATVPCKTTVSPSICTCT